jgi:hypothetical protein
VEVPLATVTPLIGSNNAGKSNIVDACAWFTAPSVLQEEDFFDPAVPVEVEGQIEGVSDAILEEMFPQHRDRLAPYVVEEQVRFKRRSSLGTSAKNIELFVFDPASGEYVRNPAGIAQAVVAMFPEPIVIEAMQIASEDVGKAKASNTIGKLLAALLAPVERDHGAEYTGQVEVLRGMLSADGATRITALREFDTAASQHLAAFFPGIAVRVDVPLPEIRDVFRAGTIRVYEGGQIGRDLTSLGHGAQRCVQMALVRMLAEQSAAKVGRTLLLIDEPELYLHPQAIELVKTAFRNLAESGYQVIYSTHSPAMLDRQAIRDVVLVRKNDARGTHRRASLPEAIERCVREREHQAEMLFSLTHASQVLFAEQVILAEGKTEKFVLPTLIEAASGRTLGAARRALVPVEGSESILPMKAVVQALDLPTKVIADLDFAFRSRSAFNLDEETEARLGRCQQHFLVMAAEGVCEIDQASGLPRRSAHASASDAYSKLAADPRVQSDLDEIVKTLREQGIWIWRRGTIEDHLGILHKDTKAWSTICGVVVTDSLDRAVTDPAAFRELAAWLEN